MGQCLAKLYELLDEGGVTEIDGWEDCVITTDGRVFRIYEIKPYDTGKGYLYVKVMIGGKVLGDYLHRLVAKAWIVNPHNLETVDHIDGDKANNDYRNLRWSSLDDNIRAYFRKDYALISPAGIEVRFNNINQFSRINDLDNSTVAKVLKGKLRTTKGWTAPRKV